MYLISYHTLFILLPRSYIIELEEHKNRWLDRRKDIKWALTSWKFARKSLMLIKSTAKTQSQI